MSGRLFIFAGGGTGGHLYPGVAIWRELSEMRPDARAVFVCSAKPLDAEILARERVACVPIPARAFGVRPKALWRFLSAWGPSVRSSRAVIERDAVVAAMGGYVAAPVVQAARAEGRPVALVNLDAVPGKANNWIARHSAVRLTAADSSRVPALWERIAPIVRRGAVSGADADRCREALGLRPGVPTLVITGGSQGAGSINALAAGLARRRAEVFRGWQVLHQTGERDVSGAAEAYRAAGVHAVVTAFVSDMASAWGAATLALARCGANTVAELWANHTPALLLPYPYHRDEHQRFNAEPLERAGGAVIVKDRVDEAANMVEAGEALAALLTDLPRVGAMRASLGALGPADGAAEAARRLIALAG